MTANENKIFYWYIEGIKLFNEWVKTKDETTWGAFCCCSAAIADYDRRHKNKKTQKLQELVWNISFLKGECTKEELKESGYFNKELLKTAEALA